MVESLTLGMTMIEQRFYTPLKIGLLTITIAYFLFNFHTIFTIEWIGEWARQPGTFNTIQLIEDINATIGNVFRFAGSILAVVALVFYYAKRSFSKNRSFLIVRIVLVFEAIYWLGLLASGMSGIWRITRGYGLLYSVGYVLPAVVESTIIPIALFILAYKLSPNKPMKGAIKWSLISATLLILGYWLLNSGIWVFVIPVKGIEYLTMYPYMMAAFLSTILGLFVLTFYSAYATKKLLGFEILQDLDPKPVGVIITGLGLFYLWNYLTWIFFGGNHVWSDWYAWLLGHNMDLWMLSLPLVGLPLLFEGRKKKPIIQTT